ncbi:hypothetical protein FRC15_009271, partial [Serendipita sp. 397]
TTANIIEIGTINPQSITRDAPPWRITTIITVEHSIPGYPPILLAFWRTCLGQNSRCTFPTMAVRPNPRADRSPHFYPPNKSLGALTSWEFV